MTVSEAQFGPLVSIIVPARNEEANLSSCLDSLVRQTGVSFEILVVNDASTDRTAEIARSFPVVRVMDAPPLPPDWTGKNNAVTAGAKNAAGPWLLFTDADTMHFPGSLAKAMAEAAQHRAALLSYSPAQEVHGFWEKSLMPVIFAELAATFRPKDVSNPASQAAAANGQYLLISREAYDAVGGHAAIAGSILEDVTLARAVKSSGRKIFFRYGGDVVQTRMYRSFQQMREGWTKNLTLLFSHPLKIAALRMTEFVLIVAGVFFAIMEVAQGNRKLAAVPGVIAIMLLGLFFRRIRRAHFSWDANLFSIAGLPLFAYLLLRSTLVHKRGNVEWKGRQYPGEAADKGSLRGTLASPPDALRRSNVSL